MVNFAPHRWAVTAAAGTLLLLVSGAVVTGDHLRESFRSIHSGIASVVGLLTVILSILLWQNGRVWKRRLAALLMICTIVLAARAGEMLSPAVHAVVAHMLFALILTAAHVTSRRWLAGPTIVYDGGFPSLRSLSLFGAGITLFQVVLGAALRHNSIGVVPHVIGAILVTVVLLIIAAFVLTQFPDHTALVRAAWAMIGMVAIQIALGVAAYVGRLSQPNHVDVSGGLLASTVAHVVFGAATLAAATDLALKVFYHVRPRAVIESGVPAMT